MSNKRKKQINKEIYDRFSPTYRYNSDYDPNAEMCIDTALDTALLYDTLYPNHDKNDYGKCNTRKYNNPNKDKK